MNSRPGCLVRWGMTVWLAGTAATPASEPVARLLACRELADAAARLACFDREAAAASGLQVPPLDPQKQFGLPERAVAAKEVAAGARDTLAAKIEARIERLIPGADGRLVFTLDNAQVWRQIEAEGDLLAKEGDAVTISRGMLGSYWLQLNSKRGCKVTRVR
jgi:hypothetical protein